VSFLAEKITPRESSAESDNKCLFCKQDVDAAASKCPHCLACIPVHSRNDAGMCPLCRKEIHPAALRCQNCKSWLIKGIETIETSVTPGAPAFGVLAKSNQGLIGTWRCEWVDQWSLFDEQTRRVWTVNICTNSGTGATKVRGGHYRKVTDKEYERIFLV
jgi:hypothetical protein